MPKSNDKDAYFFSHDCNARNDPKILALRSVYGPEGYGVYFMLIEILREQPDYKLPITKYIWNTLAMQMQMQASNLQKLVEDCCTEFTDGTGNTLLVNDGQYLFSASLLRRMGKMDEIGALRREAAKKRWENQPCKASKGDENSKEDASADDLQSECSLKEKKRNEKKGNEKKPEEKKEKKQSAVARDVFQLFADDDTDLLSALRGFEQMRNKRKKPMTDEAKKRMLASLEKLSKDRAEQIDILHQSEDRCWMGLFPLKDANGGWPQQASAADKMAQQMDDIARMQRMLGRQEKIN